jgi:hypothetical protein
MTARRLAAVSVAATLLVPGVARGAPKLPRPTALEWGGQYFVDPAALADWLRARHGNFRRWSLRHPDALATLVGATAVPQPLTSITGGGNGSRTAAAPTPAAVVATPGGSSTAAPIEAALTALSLLLLGLACLPTAPVATRFPWALRLTQQRWLLVGAAASVLVTVAVARTLG